MTNHDSKQVLAVQELDKVISEFDVIEHKYLIILSFFNASTVLKGKKPSVKAAGTVGNLLDLNETSDFCVRRIQFCL